jgi:hypothetical protein
MILARRVRSSFAGILFSCSIVLVASSRPAAAGSFDFLFSLDHVHDDTQYFLNLAVSHSGAPRQVLEPLLPRVRYLEPDLPVLLYLQHASGWSLPQLVDLRARGASWSVIFTHVGVPQAVLFDGIPDDPGPPYGNAWGYWRKNPRGARLRDSDVCDLVRIQMASGWEGARPFDLARGYAHGVTAPNYVAEKHGRPYRGAGAAPQQAGTPGKSGGHGQGHGAGHGKPHGKPTHG